MIYITLALTLIIVGGIIFYINKNSRRYRIIETVIEDDFSDHKHYTPQVRIGGIWYYIHGNSAPFPDTQYPNQFLDVQDALECIEKFKSAGNYTIPSNQRLKSNQKAIKAE